MRIAFVVGRFPALSETFILNQITGLLDRGHEVHIYADRPEDFAQMHSEVEQYKLLERTYYLGMPGGRLQRTVKGLGLLLANLPKKPGVLLRSLDGTQYNFAKYREQAAFMRLLYASVPFIDKKPYDVFHCHFAAYGLRAVLLRELGAISGKILTTFHGFDVSSYARQTNREFYQKLFALGDAYTVNTTFTANNAISLGCPPEKIITLPVGLDMSGYSFTDRTLTPTAPVKMLTVGRLVEKKGMEYSIRAVAQVARTFDQIEYNIVGTGELKSSLEKLIAELGMADKIHLLGPRTTEELRHLYAESHIFVLSSVTAANGDQEGQGLVLQEAQATGLPVISTLHNGIPDGLLDGESGFLVPERDVDALAAKLLYLIEQPQMRLEMGKTGREFVQERYDINRLNDRLVEIYRQL